MANVRCAATARDGAVGGSDRPGRDGRTFAPNPPLARTRQVQAISLREPDDFAVAFATMTNRRLDAIFLVSDVFTRSNRHHRMCVARPMPCQSAGGIFARRTMSFIRAMSPRYRVVDSSGVL